MATHLEGLAYAKTQRDSVTAYRNLAGLIQLLLALLLLTTAPSVTYACADDIAGLEAGRSLPYVLIAEPDDAGDHGPGLRPIPHDLGDDGPSPALIGPGNKPAIDQLLAIATRPAAHEPAPAPYRPCAAPPTGPPFA